MGCDRWGLRWGAIDEGCVWGAIVGFSDLGAIGYTVNMDSPKYHAQKDP